MDSGTRGNTHWAFEQGNALVERGEQDSVETRIDATLSAAWVAGARQSDVQGEFAALADAVDG